MVRGADLEHWRRYPANVTGQQLIQEAECRGWRLLRIRGDHFVFEGPRSGRTIVIPRDTGANPTKRSIISALIEEEDE